MTATVFHTAPPPWFEDYKDLAPGGSRRSDAIKVSFNGKAYLHWDFREKALEVYEPTLTLAQKLENSKALRTAEAAASQSPALPNPKMFHPQDWPTLARVWMHKAGLSNEDIATMGAYWSPSLGRVVLPYRAVDGTQGWIARYIEGRNDHSTVIRPKYLFPSGSRRGGGAVYGPVRESADIGADDAQIPVVVTEDQLSAYRVARDAGVRAVSANGTSLDRDAVVRIAAGGAAVAVWLDPDYYGQLGAKKLMSDFGRLGVENLRNIKSRVDPKLLSPQEIRDLLYPGNSSQSPGD